MFYLELEVGFLPFWLHEASYGEQIRYPGGLQLIQSSAGD
jgi:hypothetical protein